MGKTWSAAIKTDIRASLRMLARRIKRVEDMLDKFLGARPDLGCKVKLLESIPGIGRVTSVTLLARMPEPGTVDQRAIASLGGLAPKARESGKWRGHRYTGDGRRHVRRALYMAALTALRSDRFCPDLVARMRARGKSGKIIAIAVARKLLTTANAILRDQQPYKPLEAAA